MRRVGVIGMQQVQAVSVLTTAAIAAAARAARAARAVLPIDESSRPALVDEHRGAPSPRRARRVGHRRPHRAPARRRNDGGGLLLQFGILDRDDHVVGAGGPVRLLVHAPNHAREARRRRFRRGVEKP